MGYFINGYLLLTNIITVLTLDQFYIVKNWTKLRNLLRLKNIAQKDELFIYRFLSQCVDVKLRSQLYILYHELMVNVNEFED